jgi:hypothetical protein
MANRKIPGYTLGVFSIITLLLGIVMVAFAVKF